MCATGGAATPLEAVVRAQLLLYLWIWLAGGHSGITQAYLPVSSFWFWKLEIGML